MDSIKRIFFTCISFLLHCITFVFGYLHSPWTRKLTSYKVLLEMKRVMQKGDIILTRTRGEVTTLIIPGYWKHSVLYLGRDKIRHSTGKKGIHTEWIVNLIMKTDYLQIRRLKEVNLIDRCSIADNSEKYEGIKYDTFQRYTNSDKMSCSEFIRNSVNDVLGKEYIDLRYTIGYPLFTPQDIADANNKFSTVYEFKGEK